MSSPDKVSLPDFLKQLTSSKIPHSKAIHVASKIYKTHHTPVALVRLTDTSLKSLGIEEKDLRRLTLAAIKKANWNSTTTETAGPTGVRAGAHPKVGDIKSVGSTTALPSISRPGSSKPKIPWPTPQTSSTGTSLGPTSAQKRKRSTVDDIDDEFPDRPPEEVESAKYGNFDFKEVLDEDVLKVKSSVINRAPVMTAWAVIVAERLGFEREEALSIASVYYTEMNAVSKGASIGVYTPDKGKETVKKSMDRSQPYVDLMGRRIRLYRSQISHERSQWRALSSGKAIPPLDAYKYIATSMKQTTPYVVGAMRLLAGSYEPEELNRQGFSLYCELRPDIDPGKSGWGKRGKVSCEAILKLRKGRVDPKHEDVVGDLNGVKPVPDVQPTPRVKDESEGGEPRPKKPRIDDTGELDEEELFGDWPTGME